MAIHLQSPKKINTDGSSVTFTFVDKDVTGSISDIESQSVIDINQLENSVLKGSVGITTLKTGNFLRDGHLMWEKYFNRDDYPRIYFKSTTVKKQSSTIYRVQGILTMKGIDKEITLTATKSEDTITLKSTIYTSDWDVSISKERVKNKLNLKMVFKTS
jgi:polyisoprenoid-binding protein YceI